MIERARADAAPAAGVVTLRAIGAEFPVVHIAMTGGAVAEFDVHKFGEEQLVASLDFIFGNRLIWMALPTFNRLMFAGQSKLRPIM